jgi:MFS family permease
MQTQNQTTDLAESKNITENTVFAVLIAISVSHLLNDTIQSVIPAIYPILKASFHLSFTQVGLITLTFQLTASLLQPFVGLYTDHHPKPYSLAIGMGFTLIGLLLLSMARNFPMILCSAAAGTMIGGHLGDQFGRKYVIWASILGVAPFTLLLPYANLLWTGVLTVVLFPSVDRAADRISAQSEQRLCRSRTARNVAYASRAYSLGALRLSA